MDDETKATPAPADVTDIATGGPVRVAAYPVALYDEEKISVVFDDGGPIPAIVHTLAGVCSIELDQTHPGAQQFGRRPATIHLRPTLSPGRVEIPPGPSFEESMQASRDETKTWLLDLIDSLAPKLIGIMRDARAGGNLGALKDELLTEVRQELADHKTQTEQGVQMLLKPLLDRAAALFSGKPQPIASAPAASSPAPAGAIVAGSPVKVWADAERKTFRLGRVETVHDQGHSFDVVLDDDQSVAHVQADGLALDETAT